MNRSALGVRLALVVSVSTFGTSQSTPAWVPESKWSSFSVLCLTEDTRTELAAKAESGDADAQDRLGTQHLSGCQGKNDPEKGIDLLNEAAAQGNAHAQFALGEAYQRGGSVARDMNRAVMWFQRAAANGDARAQNNMGVVCQGGNPLPKDEERAIKLFQAAAEQDLPEAAYNLATMLDQGRGTAQDLGAARFWYQQAAERRLAEAEYRLAMLLDQGLGGETDPVAALRWFKRAAEDGSEAAQVKIGTKISSQLQTVSSGYFEFEIARAMIEGNGMEKDESRGLKFLEKSAERGYAPAFLALGRLYARGQLVAKNDAKAVGYLEQAIARDDKFEMAYNTLSWTLVASQDAAVRNPQRALLYASKAVELNGGREPHFLDTLAHAYFQLGQAQKALETEIKAAALAPNDAFIQKTLAEYKQAIQPAGPH